MRPPASVALVRRLQRHPDGLLCALALGLGELSRNRNFGLYAADALRRVHRRARSLRSLARALGQPAPDRVVQLHAQGELTRLLIHQPSVALRRRVLLEPLEVSLLKILVSRSGPKAAQPLAPAPCDLARVADALVDIGLALDAPAPAAASA